jgi:putative tricarboxylic transport membrane protein
MAAAVRIFRARSRRFDHKSKLRGEAVQRAVRGARDFFAGLLFLFFGALALYLALDYPMGSAMRMGPGYFPVILGGLLSVLGLLTLVRGLVQKSDPPRGFALASLLLVLGAVGLFALTVERFGIVVSVTLVVAVSSLASGRFRWLEVLALTVVMVALAVGLFTEGLGLPFKVLPG